MTNNKYSKYFNKSMTSSEARSVFFALHSKDTPEHEKQQIFLAYKPICEFLVEKELKLAKEKELMM